MLSRRVDRLLGESRLGLTMLCGLAFFTQRQNCLQTLTFGKSPYYVVVLAKCLRGSRAQGVFVAPYRSARCSHILIGVLVDTMLNHSDRCIRGRVTDKHSVRSVFRGHEDAGILLGCSVYPMVYC